MSAIKFGDELTFLGEACGQRTRALPVMQVRWLEDRPRDACAAPVLMGRNGRPRTGVNAFAPTSQKSDLVPTLAVRRRPDCGAMTKHKLAPMTCDYCGVEYMGRTDRPADANHFCGRRCSGIASRLGKARPWQERFWGFLPDPRPDDGACWEWTGYHRPPKGYGILPLGSGKGMLAHRASYFLHFEELPPEIFVCHRCDNPPCVNPAHLFAGTNADNMADMAAKGRSAPQGGAHNGMARLSVEDVAAIRALAARGASYADVARRFGVSGTHVGRIVSGECWSDLRGLGQDEAFDAVSERSWPGATR